MRRIIEFFTKDSNNLEKNLENYAKKEKAKQQKSKILGQKPSNWTKDKRKKINKNCKRLQSICSFLRK